MDCELIKKLNAPSKEERLRALTEIAAARRNGASEQPRAGENVNNHIHTTYSFSPYSPSMAAYLARQNGLATAGIIDHDSMAGAEEFIEAGKVIGIAVTVGFECRCDMRGTPFRSKNFNNPDQNSIAYFTMHGVPHVSIARVENFLRPYRERRNVRNRAMVENLNRIGAPLGVLLDFDADVAAVSNCGEGGSITERHILYAFSEKMIQRTGRGKPLAEFLIGPLGVPLAGAVYDRIMDARNDMYVYYLLNMLKGEFLRRFYIDAFDECPALCDFFALGEEIGAIPAYAYLGDVSGSVTGDKKDQLFEDGYLDEFVDYLAGYGFKALTFMPSRNTPRQLKCVTALCEKHRLFQISGEDINSPFQPFVCDALTKPEHKNLIESAWALVGHEKTENGMFSEKMTARFPDLDERIKYFAALGRGR